MSQLSIIDLLEPNHIVIVGATEENAGGRFVKALEHGGFEGLISVVHPGAAAVGGHACYPTIDRCPTPVDHVIVAVGGPAAVELAVRAADAGARLVHLYAGGFAEVDDPSGAALQREVERLVERTTTRVIGPNCMGFHRPSVGVTFRDDLPMRRGPLGVVSQSGGVAIAAIRMAEARSLGTSAVISFGNGADFAAEDALRLLGADDETEVIAVYLESAANDSLTDALREISREKSVVVWPCVTSPAALAASRRHTGAPGGMIDVATLPDTCVVVDRLADFIDAAHLLSRSRDWTLQPKPCFVSISGGFAVGFVSAATSVDVRLAELDATTISALRRTYGAGAGNLTNPLDLGEGYLSRGRMAAMFELLAKDPNVDVVVFHVAWDFVAEVATRVAGFENGFLDALTEAPLPVLFYFPQLDGGPGEAAARSRLRATGAPVFDTVESLLRVLQAVRGS